MGLINYWRRTPRRVLQRIFPKWKRVSLEGKKRNWKLIGIEQTIDLIRSKNRTLSVKHLCYHFRILTIAKDIPSNQKTETLQPPKEKREHQVPVLFWTFAWHFGSGSALPVYQGWGVWEAAQEGVGGKKCLKLAAGPRVKRRRVGASTLHQQHHHPPRFQRKPFHFWGNCTVFLKSWLLAHVVDWISRQVAPCLVWSPTKPALPSTLPSYWRWGVAGTLQNTVAWWGWMIDVESLEEDSPWGDVSAKAFVFPAGTTGRVTLIPAPVSKCPSPQLLDWTNSHSNHLTARTH